MKNTIVSIVLGIGVLGVIGLQMSRSGTSVAHASEMIMYKSPTCGCCVQYKAALKKEGYDVDVRSTVDMGPVKTEHTIPPQLESCHTIEVDGYVIEGHVPLEAVNRMLTEKPAIDGIGLPGMPAGSPGMPGIKRAPFEVYSLVGGTSSLFMKI